MDENIKKKKTDYRYVIFTVVMVIAFVGMFVTAGWKISEMNDLIESQKVLLADNVVEIGEMYENIGQASRRIEEISSLANTRIESLILENKALKHKLELLRAKEDLPRRDLEAYILKKYRTIPEVVATEVASQAVKLTKEQGVPFSLIVGLIEVESHFKPWAVSKKGARGLMQVMPFWVKNKKADLGLKSKFDLHDIGTNIEAGIKIFKIHLEEAKNDINQGLYLYVGKDKTYADKVFNAMGRFEIFRSTLDTKLRDGTDQDAIESTGEKTPPAIKKKVSLKRLTFDKEAYKRA